MPRWHEWAVFTAGLWLALSPWLVGYAAHPAVTANAAIVGLALAASSLELDRGVIRLLETASHTLRR